MATIATSTVPYNGLPLHSIALPGTRALTVLVAFDAGARTERPEENGMAHFLEHLVFKGGEKYPHYRDVNEPDERLCGSPRPRSATARWVAPCSAPRSTCARSGVTRSSRSASASGRGRAAAPSS